MSRAIVIRPATAADLAFAESWLSASGLPTADLTPDHMQYFLVAAEEDMPVGLIGLETFGNVGLLRSLLVSSRARGIGTGALLVAQLEIVARENGVAELWLLTTDADPYFSKLGYNIMDRSDAPDAIRGTAEFSSLCPGDAVLMRKCL